jgi:hypothetical protein
LINKIPDADRETLHALARTLIFDVSRLVRHSPAMSPWTVKPRAPELVQLCALLAVCFLVRRCIAGAAAAEKSLRARGPALPAATILHRRAMAGPAVIHGVPRVKGLLGATTSDVRWDRFRQARSGLATAICSRSIGETTDLRRHRKLIERK